MAENAQDEALAELHFVSRLSPGIRSTLLCY